MLRSLLWKEWREQRAVVIAGGAVAVLMPGMIFAGLGLAGATQRTQEVLTLLPIANWVLLWPLAALATGASAVTGEFGDGRFGFLLSRPVSRTTLLAVKLVVAAVVALSIIFAGQGMATLAGWALADPATEVGTPPAVDLQSMDRLLVEGVVVFAAVCFAFAAFLSLMLSRAIHVVPLAGIAAAGAYGANLLLWWRLDYLPVVDWRMTAWPLALAVALVGATFLSFQRGELLRDASHLWRTTALGALVVGLWLAGTGAMAAHEMRPPRGELVFEGLAVSPDGAALAAAVARDGRAASRTVGILEIGGELTLVGQRLSSHPAFSPDGRYVAYVVMSDAVGLRSKRGSLFVHDRATGRERMLAAVEGETFAALGHPVFSADGRYVAADLHWDTVIANVDGSVPARRFARMPGYGNTPSCRVVGWDTTRGHLMRSCQVTETLQWLDPDSGRPVNELRSPDGVRGRWYGGGWLPDRHSVLRVRETYEDASEIRRDRTGVLDLETMDITWLLDDFYGTVAFSDVAAPAGGSEPLVVYSRPSATGDRTEVVTLRPQTSVETVLSQHPPSDWGATLSLSPGARWLFARVRTGAMIERLVVSNLVFDLTTGETYQAGGVDAAAWYGSAWLDEARLVYLDAMISTPAAERTTALAAQQGWSREIRILDASTGVETLLWPRPQ